MRPPIQRLQIFGELDPRYLLHYVALNESNVAISGLPGFGKTTLVKTMLKHMPKGFAAVVFDTANDYGNDVCDERGEFSVDVSRIEPRQVADVIEEALDADYSGYAYMWTPAMTELTIRALKSGIKLSELADRINEVAKPQEESTAAGVYRRGLHFQYPHFGDAPPLNPRPGVVTCVDMGGMDPVGYIAYVLFVVHMLRSRRNIFYIIDEAHKFLRTRRALLNEAMRVGRHFMHLFVLITQRLADIKGREGFIKIFVQFPEGDNVDIEAPHWGRPHKALVVVHVSNERAAKALPGKGVLRGYLLTIRPPSKSDFLDIDI